MLHVRQFTGFIPKIGEKLEKLLRRPPEENFTEKLESAFQDLSGFRQQEKSSF